MEKELYRKKREEIWNGFITTFNNPVSEKGYRTDIYEIMSVVGKEFLEIKAEDAASYYSYLTDKQEARKLSPSTVARKIRDLSSFSDYILTNRAKYEVNEKYENHFLEYKEIVEKRRRLANNVPLEDINRLFEVSEKSPQHYAILTLLYRMNMMSTEICALNLADLAVYENGTYIRIKNRKQLNYVPDDVSKILSDYIESRRNDVTILGAGEWAANVSIDKGKEISNALFFNSLGDRLNPTYICRMMKKLCESADTVSYSAESIRNSGIYTMRSFGGAAEDIAAETGITKKALLRYCNVNYIDETSRKLHMLTKVKVE